MKKKLWRHKFYFKIFYFKKALINHFADIIKFLNMFIKKTFKHQKQQQQQQNLDQNAIYISIS